MKKLRVLLADDGCLSRNLLQSSLSYWGCEVITVEDGMQACSALHAGNIDVCILNWNMPKLSGPGTCRWIRQAELKTEPYVILLTEKNSPENIREAYLAGANDFLTTPFRLEDVRDRISTIARKVSHVHAVHHELGRMDPLECYRMDLALHAKNHPRL